MTNTVKTTFYAPSIQRMMERAYSDTCLSFHLGLHLALATICIYGFQAGVS